MTLFKTLFSLQAHKRFINKMYIPEKDEFYLSSENFPFILRKTIRFVLYLMIVYVIVYCLVFIVGFSYYSKLNEIMKLSYEKRGEGEFSFLINSYPFNVVFVITLMWIFIIFATLISYLLSKILESDTRTFKQHAGIVFQSSSILLSSIFPILIVNTIYPFDEPINFIYLGLLFAFWFVVLGAGIFFSSKTYYFLNQTLFQQHKRRAIVVWLFSIFLFTYLIMGIISAGNKT